MPTFTRSLFYKTHLYQTPCQLTKSISWSLPCQPLRINVRRWCHAIQHDYQQRLARVSFADLATYFLKSRHVLGNYVSECRPHSSDTYTISSNEMVSFHIEGVTSDWLLNCHAHYRNFCSHKLQLWNTHQKQIWFKKVYFCLTGHIIFAVRGSILDDDTMPC